MDKVKTDESLRGKLKQLQEKGELNSGFSCIRCIECIAPILSEFKITDAEDTVDMRARLVHLILTVNHDYMMAADSRMSESTGRLLHCGNDCNYYEEKKEACPFSFLESDIAIVDELLSIIRQA